MNLQTDHFTLDQFEGTLDFLLFLIQKDEIDIYEVPILSLIDQFNEKFGESILCQLDRGAEFISSAAYLIWLKSRTLLPYTEPIEGSVEIAEDPHFEIIHHLIDYNRFKQATKQLCHLQDQQQAHYFRGIEPPDWQKPLGIDHLSLEQLAELFSDMLSRATKSIPPIEEESYRVSDKIKEIKELLSTKERYSLSKIISTPHSRLEIIVTFLAILELIKIGMICIGKSLDSEEIILFLKNGEQHG
jgi:segregation and condensation protein A